MNEEELKKKYGTNNLGNPDIDEYIFENTPYMKGYKEGFQKGKLEEKKELVAKWDKGYEQGYSSAISEVREKIEECEKYELFEGNRGIFIRKSELKELLSQLEGDNHSQQKQERKVDVKTSNSFCVTNSADTLKLEEIKDE